MKKEFRVIKFGGVECVDKVVRTIQVGDYPNWMSFYCLYTEEEFKEEYPNFPIPEEGEDYVIYIDDDGKLFIAEEDDVIGTDNNGELFIKYEGYITYLDEKRELILGD